MKTLASVSLSMLLLSAAPARAAQPNGLIAYVDTLGGLLVVRPDGSAKRKLGAGEIQQIALTQGAPRADTFRWPMWAPDGRRLACFAVTLRNDQPLDELYVFDAVTTQVLNVFKDTGLGPIYGYWAPDGRSLAMLLARSGSFSLSLWPPSEGDQPQSVANGVPFFFDWKHDGRGLVIHAANDPEAPHGHAVSLLDLPSRKRRVLSAEPAAFAAPSWSADGEWLAYGSTDGDHEKLMVAHADGGGAKAVATIPERAAFAWSPNKALIALLVSTVPGDAFFDELRMIDVAAGRTTLVHKGSMAAFFWSPLGDRILVIRRDTQAGDLMAMVTDLEGKHPVDVAGFLPSRPQIMVLQYFDQYALSHRIWSPDGKAFLFSGASRTERGSRDALELPAVYVVAADGKSPPRSIGDGNIAFWSPRDPR